MTFKVDRVVTSGVSSLDGQEQEVSNNVWVVGDETQAVVIDASHSTADILAAVGDRHVRAILCTHALGDHINVAAELSEETDAPIHVHPDDAAIWESVYPTQKFDKELSNGAVVRFGENKISVLHTPGNSPGGCCFHIAAQGMVFTGDTLFEGGPIATDNYFGDGSQTMTSIDRQLFSLPPETIVHPAHGESTSVGVEAANLAPAEEPVEEVVEELVEEPVEELAE